MNEPNEYMNLLCESNTVRLGNNDYLEEGKKGGILGALAGFAGGALTWKMTVTELKAERSRLVKMRDKARTDEMKDKYDEAIDQIDRAISSMKITGPLITALGAVSGGLIGSDLENAAEENKRREEYRKAFKKRWNIRS
jgi:hypothetical protein